MDRRTFSKLTTFAGIGALTRGFDLLSPKVLASAAGPTPEQGSRLWKQYLLGAAYYPEWWQAAECKEDFARMQKLGINAVRMGEFAWALFEPAAGKFEFKWMDEAIDVANRHGINVILSTPTAAVPPWLYQAHPDVLGGNDSGPYTYGGRKGYCTNSQAYLDASARVTTALARHYGAHPGVIGWQLDNEPGFPFVCYDPESERAFQQWLKKRYGTLDELNRVWNGAFWSNQYSDWAQIRIPRNSAEGGWQPAIILDYRRFFSDSFLNHLRQQATILRKDIKDQFIFTNWPGLTWSVDVFAAGSEFLDATAWDNYVSAPGLGSFQRQYIAGLNHDFSRCAGPNQRFLCAEQIAYVPSNALDQGLRLQAYIDLAHGCYGQIYFEWRRPLAGGEQYRPSLIQRVDGTINPAKPVFEQIAKEFGRLGPRLAGAITRADIALLFDFSNHWSQGFLPAPGNRDRRYDQEAYRYYNGFKVLQRNLDILPTTAELSNYRVVVAQNLRLIDDATLARLRAFVSRGGVLVLNYRAGTQNMDCSMRRVISPGVFTEMAGVRAESYLDLVELAIVDKTQLGIAFSGKDDVVFHPRTILESLTLQGAEPIATFRGGRMTGLPAITRHRYGQGWVFYVATDSGEDAFHEALAKAVGATAGLSPLIAAPYGVEVVSRENADTVFYFLLNLTENTHNGIKLPRPMQNLLTGQERVTEVSLGAVDVAVLATPKA